MLAKIVAERIRVWPRFQEHTLDQLVESLNRTAVLAYKFAGFVLLSLILFGMFSYLAVSAFFLFSSRWVVPTILTETNDKVVQAHLGWLEQKQHVAKLEAQLLNLKQDLHLAGMSRVAWNDFGVAFEAALNKSAITSKTKLRALEGVASIVEGPQLAPALSATELDRQLALGIINIDEYSRLSKTLADSNLERAESQKRAVDMREQAESLKVAIHAGSSTKVGLDVDSLIRRKALLESKLEVAKSDATGEVLAAEIGGLESILATYREVLAQMGESPYVRAANSKLFIAFVPYSNLHSAKEGAAVYSCMLTFALCSQVGTALKIVGGEIVSKHPITGREIRGRTVELALDRPESGEHQSLVLGRPPLFL